MKLKKSFCIITISGLIWLFWGLSLNQANSNRYHILIKDTKIIDGRGKPAFKGSIAIKGERIVAVGKVKGNAATVIDGSGLMTCPGFIDPHSHADLTIMKYPLAENLIMQGMTTMITGNCASSPAPLKELTFGEWLSKVEELGISINMAPLVGHNPIRRLVMGADWRREATSEEIEEMKKHIREAMESGAFGFSCFRDPAPSHFADIEEIIELAKVVHEYQGLYVPHTTDVQEQWPTDDPEEVSYVRRLGPIENVWVGKYRGFIEAIEVSRRTKIRLHIAHLDSAYRIPQPHPDFLEEAAAKATLWIIDKARREGIDLTFDVIASDYGFSKPEPLVDSFYSTRVPALHWVRRMERDEFVERLKTKEFRSRLRRVHDNFNLKFGMVHTKVDPYWSDIFKILSCKNKEYEGKTIGEIARRKDADPLETVFKIMVEDPEAIWVQFWDRRGNEISNSVWLKHPIGMPCTDVGCAPLDLKNPQLQGPPSYGLYAHYIGTYIRERSIQSLEEAIRKATSLPAQRFGLEDRGILKPGAYADVLVFDYENIRHTGDFLNPAQRPDGVEYVIVNGTIVYKDKSHTGERPGKVLRNKRY